MTRSVMCALVFFGGLVPAESFAENFRVAIKVTSGDKSADAGPQQTEVMAPKGSKVSPAASARKATSRPALTIPQKQLANVSWEARDTSSTVEFKDLLVHVIVVREKRSGEREVPPPTQDVVYEGAITTDFKPKDLARGEFTLTIGTPGSYLLRVETIGLQETQGHEHFAALDLLVE